MKIFGHLSFYETTPYILLLANIVQASGLGAYGTSFYEKVWM